jgi:hypothetical protein
MFDSIAAVPVGQVKALFSAQSDPPRIARARNVARAMRFQFKA